MSQFETSILKLIAPAIAIAGLLVIAAVVMIRRLIARDWRALSLKIDDPLALILFTIVAALLRVARLGRPMGSDESATFLYYASKPLIVGLTVYGSPNNHLLHTALMHGSMRLFGDAEWALRLPALIAGIAIVPLSYIASRAIAGRGALLASAMAAAWPALIDYSTDARGYTLLCCFVLVCAVTMAEVRRSGNAAAGAIFAVSAALGFFTIPVMIYPFVMLVVWGKKRALPGAAAAIVLALFLYTPALLVSGFASLTQNPYVRALPLNSFTGEALSYVITAHHHLFVAVPVIVQILIAIGFIVAMKSHDLAMLWVGFIAVIVLVAIQRVLPFPRVWLPFVVLMMITAAASWPWRDRSEAWIAAAMTVVLAMTGMTVSRARETGELRAIGQIVRELNLRARKGDPVLALPPSEMPLAFYCPRVEVLHPDLGARRIFVVENRDYGQSLERTLAYFHMDRGRFTIVRLRDFGSAALYEMRK